MLQLFKWFFKDLVYRIISEHAHVSDASQRLDEIYLMHNRFYLRLISKLKLKRNNVIFDVMRRR